MKKLLLMVVAVSLLSACQKDDLYEQVPQQEAETEERTRASGDEDQMIILGKKLPNPYSLQNMQQAYDEISRTNGLPSKTLSPTHIYVRFLPASQAEFYSLYQDYDLTLSDYPLDYEILRQGDYYHDPMVHKNNITWQYATIEKDARWPAHIKHEILADIYIPEDVETRAGDYGIGDLMEVRAYEITGLDEMFGASLPTRGSSNVTTGVVTVYDNALKKVVPLKGVKVRCSTMFKTGDAFTDENGRFSISRSFNVNPQYNLIFENIKGFDIYTNLGYFRVARSSLGKHSKSGYSPQINETSNRWAHCIANNAGYEYYQMCQQNGIKTRQGLRVDLWRNRSGRNAAPMLKAGNFALLVVAEISGYLAELFMATQFLFQHALPDICLATNGKDAAGIHYLVHHEFAHSSHFENVLNSSYWSTYARRIAANGSGNPYGDGTEPSAGHVAVGEMWGYFMGYAGQYEKYHGGVIGTDRSYPGISRWWPHQLLWNLYRDQVLTKTQIYACLTQDVTTVDKLTDKMLALYPNRASQINQAMTNIGMESKEYVSTTYLRIQNNSGTDVKIKAFSIYFLPHKNGEVIIPKGKYVDVSSTSSDIKAYNSLPIMIHAYDRPRSPAYYVTVSASGSLIYRQSTTWTHKEIPQKGGYFDQSAWSTSRSMTAPNTFKFVNTFTITDDHVPGIPVVLPPGSGGVIPVYPRL